MKDLRILGEANAETYHKVVPSFPDDYEKIQMKEWDHFYCTDKGGYGYILCSSGTLFKGELYKSGEKQFSVSFLGNKKVSAEIQLMNLSIDLARVALSKEMELEEEETLEK